MYRLNRFWWRFSLQLLLVCCLAIGGAFGADVSQALASSGDYALVQNALNAIQEVDSSVFRPGAKFREFNVAVESQIPVQAISKKLPRTKDGLNNDDPCPSISLPPGVPPKKQLILKSLECIRPHNSGGDEISLHLNLLENVWSSPSAMKAGDNDQISPVLCRKFNVTIDVELFAEG